MTAFTIGVLVIAFAALFLNLITTPRKPKQHAIDFSEPPSGLNQDSEHEHRGAAMSRLG